MIDRTGARARPKIANERAALPGEARLVLDALRRDEPERDGYFSGRRGALAGAATGAGAGAGAAVL
jgi:hypothetical protein